MSPDRHPDAPHDPGAADAPPEASARAARPADADADADAGSGLDHAAVLARLDTWVQQGWLRELDRCFAAFLSREAPDAAPLLILTAALASHQLGRGHACLSLAATLLDAEAALALPPPDAPTAVDTRQAAPAPDLGDAASPAPLTPTRWLDGLSLSRWLAALVHPLLVGAGEGNTPLVRDGARLYLRRYWQYEQSVRLAMDARLAPSAPPSLALDAAQARRDHALSTALTVLFPRPGGAPATATDWQQVACALATRHRLSIVTGGPGTGKTTTVVRLLALLQFMRLSGADAPDPPDPSDPPETPAAPLPRLRIRLAAPTGKAAARLNESIAGAVGGLPLAGLPLGDAVRDAIPTTVTTLHRLLGSRPGTRHFRHGPGHPLPLDVLVIDEASMVDLEMMATVLAALPASARLVLLGDKDQLASVEAGAVLGELCARADAGHFTPATRDWVRERTGQVIDDAWVDPAGRPLDQAVVTLRHSHRFSAASGIGQLAAAVNAGEAARARKLLHAGLADLAVVRLDRSAASLPALVLDGAPDAFGADLFTDLPPAIGLRDTWRDMHRRRPPSGAPQPEVDAWAASVLNALSRFQVLCALRHGPFGVEGMNQRIAQLLRAEGLVSAEAGWYAGRPVMVTRNDHRLGLMNGDVGITLALPDRDSGGDMDAGMSAEGRAGGDIDPDAARTADTELDADADALRARPPRPLPGAGRLRVAFPLGDGSGGVRWVLPSRLAAVETAFAMTVHKSQGSEFGQVVLVLPERLSPVLTRELVYTGITRARHRFVLALSSPGHGVLDAAVLRRVVRSSGLLG